MKNRVTLIIPNSMWHHRRPWRFLSHTALILSALLKDDFEFSVLDANVHDLSEDACRAQLAALAPDCVLVSGFGVEYHLQYHTAMAIARSVSPDIVTVLGGVYPTVMPEDCLGDKNIDYIFMGHAEERAVDFLKSAIARDRGAIESFPGIGFRDNDGNIRINPVATYIGDVKNLAKPDYSFTDVEAYLTQKFKDYQFNSDRKSTQIITSYGCPYNCMFCAARTINGRKVAFRSVEDILEEIDLLTGKYGVENLVFLDDCLLLKRDRVDRLFNAIIDRKYDLTWKVASLSAWHLDDALLELMKRAGCTQITISVESGSQRVVTEIMRKPLKIDIVPGIVRKCKELGIDVGANFVIGLPGETWEEIRETFLFAESCDFDLAHFHIATPLPASDLYETAKQRNLLPHDFSFFNPKFFGYGRGYIETKEFTPFELMILRSFEYDRINFSTPEKTAKVARMMNLSLDELNEHRRQTRRKAGVHF